MRTSDIQDSNGALVKEGDKVSFSYEGVTITTDIKYNNGCFIAVSPNNIPISCMLCGIDKHTDSFTIVI